MICYLAHATLHRFLLVLDATESLLKAGEATDSLDISHFNHFLFTFFTFAVRFQDIAQRQFFTVVHFHLHFSLATIKLINK